MIVTRHIGHLIFAAYCMITCAAKAAPERVVSMNLCTDQLSMLLAAPGQLHSVSYLASDPRASAMANEASRFQVNRGLAEEVFLMRPDLVIAGTYTTRATVDMLKRLGVEVVEVAPANSLDDVRIRVREIGAVLGREAAAEHLVDQFDADLEAARVVKAARPRTALYYANSYTLGEGTLAHSVVDAAGLANLAIELGYKGGGHLPLEQLVMETPDLVVTGRDQEGSSLAEETLTHPALAALWKGVDDAPVSDRNWICGTPFVIAAVRRLVVARDAILASR